MLRLLSISSLLVLITISCKSAEGSRDPVASYPDIQFIPKETDTARTDAGAKVPDPIAAPVVPLVLAPADCKPEDAPRCPIEESDTPYRSVTIKYNGQLLPDSEQINAWANSPCQSRLELYKAVCAKGMDYSKVEVASHPDANEGTCPAIFKDCPTTQLPTRCFAQAFEDQELTWSNRPEAWGSNECEARNKLKRKACSNGLDPKDIKLVSCEPEPSPLMCPPIWKNCVDQGSEQTVCKLGKVGEINLKQPLSAIGSTRCEATYRVQDLACRFQKSEIKDFSGIQCQAIGKESSEPVQAYPVEAPEVKQVQPLN